MRRRSTWCIWYIYNLAHSDSIVIVYTNQLPADPFLVPHVPTSQCNPANLTSRPHAEEYWDLLTAASGNVGCSRRSLLARAQHRAYFASSLPPLGLRTLVAPLVDLASYACGGFIAIDRKGLIRRWDADCAVPKTLPSYISDACTRRTCRCSFFMNLTWVKWRDCLFW